MLLQKRTCRAFLLQELTLRQKRNPRYSQRAFAKELGLNQGEVSEVLAGKRNLSLQSVIKVSSALGLTRTEAEYLVLLAQRDRSRKMPGSAAALEHSEALEKRELSMELFQVVSEWYCFAILNLADCIGFRWNPNWIAKRLGITAAQVRFALDRLLSVGLIKKKSKQQFEIVDDYVLSPSGIPSEAIRNYHRQILEKSIRSLEIHSVKKREISGVALAMDARDLDKMKQDVRKFQDEMMIKYASKRGNEVYHLELALIPLTEEKN